MVSESNQIERLVRQQIKDAAPSVLESQLSMGKVWVSVGGVATNGMEYSSPRYAVAWGNKGCPLLPRLVRQHQKGIKLPHELQKAFGVPLTLDQLDSGVIERLSSNSGWQRPLRIFRHFLYGNMPIIDTLVAIPAGIPLAWFEALPITSITRAAVRRAFEKTGADVFLRVPILARQFLGMPSASVNVLNELTCVIESAELGRTSEVATVDLYDSVLQQEPDEHEAPSDSAGPETDEGLSAFNRRLSEFARWAMAETDALTFGEAIAELIRAGAANEVWKPVALVSLTDLAMHSPHPYETIDRWMEQIDPRSQAIFMSRVSYHPQNIVSLEELGDGFGVTRERIRQVEAKIRRILNGFLTSDEALPIRWRASSLRRALSVAAPVHTVQHLLRAPPGCNDHRDILLRMAGPYDRKGDWLTLRSARSGDPTSAILTQVDEVGQIDREFATSKLTEWGLDVALHERWLTRDGSVRLFNGQLVLWGTSVSDRLAFALADMGRPATVDEMVTHVGENRSRNSINNALAGDPRLVKVSRSHWALASWDLAEYSGIAASMRNIIEEFGGSIPIDTMVHRMHKMFGVEEKSTLTYCGAPMFIVEGETLRLRTQHDGPYRYDSDLIRRTPGVFSLGPKRLGRLLNVDRNMLRGSGTVLTLAAGSILGVEVKAHLSFCNRHGDKVDITFPETSILGPSIGSVRLIVERLSAKEGDFLTLVLDRSEMTVSACLTNLNGQSPGWDVIGRLTGIAKPVDLGGLAKALSCSAEEVRSVLKGRGDNDILALLPRTEASSGLDDALSVLENHVEQVRGSLL